MTEHDKLPDGQTWNDLLSLTAQRSQWDMVFAVGMAQFDLLSIALHKAITTARQGDLEALVISHALMAAVTELQTFLTSVSALIDAGGPANHPPPDDEWVHQFQEWVDARNAAQDARKTRGN